MITVITLIRQNRSIVPTRARVRKNRYGALCIHIQKHGAVHLIGMEVLSCFTAERTEEGFASCVYVEYARFHDRLLSSLQETKHMLTSSEHKTITVTCLHVYGHLRWNSENAKKYTQKHGRGCFLVF